MYNLIAGLLFAYIGIGTITFLCFITELYSEPKGALAYAIFWPIFFVRYLVKAFIFALTNNDKWLE